jgi:hypothetical protein
MTRQSSVFCCTSLALIALGCFVWLSLNSMKLVLVCWLSSLEASHNLLMFRTACWCFTRPADVSHFLLMFHTAYWCFALPADFSHGLLMFHAARWCFARPAVVWQGLLLFRTADWCFALPANVLLDDRDSIPGKAKRFFSSPQWGPPSLLISGYRGLFLQG